MGNCLPADREAHPPPPGFRRTASGELVAQEGAAEKRHHFKDDPDDPYHLKPEEDPDDVMNMVEGERDQEEHYEHSDGDASEDVGYVCCSIMEYQT